MGTERNIRAALFLSAFTIVYNLIEGMVSLYFGISEEAVSLAGFGGDSLIEVASAVLVAWRFWGETEKEKRFINRERVATFGIGVLFGLLCVLTLIAALLRLSEGAGPQTTLPGVIISLVSISFMFYLFQAKKSLALKLDSATLMSDARCSLACIKLSFILLIGSAITWLMPGLWWADPAAAILLAVLIGKEGIEMIRESRKEAFSGGCC